MKCAVSVQSTKFKGILFNPSTEWTDHIQLMKQKGSKTIGILKYFTNKQSIKALRSLYFVLVNPNNEYANIVWSGGALAALKSWLLTQKKVLLVESIGESTMHRYLLNFVSTICFKFIKCKLLVLCLKFVIVKCLLISLISLKLIMTFIMQSDTQIIAMFHSLELMYSRILFEILFQYCVALLNPILRSYHKMISS